jgi:hypothetical protein
MPLSIVTNPESGSVSTKAVQKAAASSGGAGGGNGAGGIGSKLKGLFGGVLRRHGGEEKRRVVRSRIIGRSQAERLGSVPLLPVH